MFYASTLLLLTVPGLAHAGNEVSIETIEIAHHGIEVGIVVLTDDPDATAASIAAEVVSDGGAEDVTLTESDAWLHGAASIAKLPSADATLTLTVYDSGNAVLAEFTGAIDATGTVSGMVRADYCGDGVGHTRNGTSIDIYDELDRCGTKGEDGPDVELLAAETVTGEGGAFDVIVDLDGADTYAVAYAQIGITDGKSTTKEEVGWQTVGAVWEGTLALDHEGLVEVKAVPHDRAGKKLGARKVKLGAPLHDGGSGVNTLATDEDPLTRLAVSNELLVVLSTDWTSTTAPVSAQIELEGGDTLTVPANSYQVTAAIPVTLSGTPEKEAFQVTIDGNVVKAGVALGDRGICANGTCVALQEGSDGTWTLSATAYATSASKLPSSVKIALDATLKAAATKEASYTLTYGSDVAVLYANEVSLAADPIGVDLSGKVSLLGEADKKGKQKTLSKGKFHGTLGRSLDGDLGLAGADKDEVSPKGDILIGGEPIDFELVDTDKDGVIEAPPVIVLRTESNGKGTRAVTTASNGKPALL